MINRKFMGQRMEATNEYVVYELNKEVTFTGTANSADFTHSYLTKSTSEGTKVTSRMRMEPKGLFGLAEPLVTPSLRREFLASLGGLKDMLESRAVAAAS